MIAPIPRRPSHTRSPPPLTASTSNSQQQSNSRSMLPMWMKGGTPIVGRATSFFRDFEEVFRIVLENMFAHLQPINLTRRRTIPVPLIPLVLVGGFIFLFWTLRSPPKASPFVIKPSLFISPPPYPPPPSYLPAPVEPKARGMVVPHAVHYVYGLKPVREGEKPEELPYYAYLAMRSALINIRPKKMFFHYEHLPTGPWWDLIEPHLTPVKTVVPETYLGRELKHFAHRADVLRLLAMKHSGGIYLDIDMFVVKPFDDLMYHPTTLGMQMSTNSEASDLEPQGLCNAVIVSAPHSSFIDRWLATYETFDNGAWDRHSVNMPWELARRYPDEVQVLSNRAFFYPMWHGNEIEKTHELDEHDFRASGQYAYHAWESLAMKYLKGLSPSGIRQNDNSFNRLVRPFIGENDDAVFARWKASQA